MTTLILAAIAPLAGAILFQALPDTPSIKGEGGWEIVLVSDAVTGRADLALRSSGVLIRLGPDGRPAVITTPGHDCRARPLIIRVDGNKAILLGEQGRRNVDLAIKQMSAGGKATLAYYGVPCKSPTYVDIDLRGFSQTLEKAGHLQPREREALKALVVAEQEKVGKAAVETQLKTYPSRVLLDAARAGDLAHITAALDAGADIDAQSEGNGYTPLLWAAARGHLNAVRTLLEAGAALNARAQDGQTPLMRASDNGHLEIVKLLLDSGADVNVRTENEVTALKLATLKNRTAIVELLKKAGARE